MKKNININPVGLKGYEITDRMKELMGMQIIKENDNKSFVIELTKIGPDDKAYAIVRENHEYYIKITDKKNNILAEDFNYIGGLKNKKSEAYPSYAKAIKSLNFKFRSLAEAFNKGGDINVFENDNLISESGVAGFSQYNGNGFSNEGNLEGNTPLAEESDIIDDEEIELSEAELAVEKMMEEDSDIKNPGKYSDGAKEKAGVDDDGDGVPNGADKKPKDGSVNEHKLSIVRALENIDGIIDSLSEVSVKKKVYTLK